jgi:radical SAM-linked protein
MLLGALRRAGFQIALSRGPKPRPVIALAMPRAVGVESEAELADVELAHDHDPSLVAERLSSQLPGGVTLIDVGEATGKPAASLVQHVGYTVEVGEDVDWDTAARAYARADEAVVTRTAPDKADKRVDVRCFCTGVQHEPGRLVFDIELSPTGAARPEEVVQAVAAQIGATPTMGRIVRTAIVLRDPAGVNL